MSQQLQFLMQMNGVRNNYEIAWKCKCRAEAHSVAPIFLMQNILTRLFNQLEMEKWAK